MNINETTKENSKRILETPGLLGRAIDLSRDMKTNYGNNKVRLADALGISVGALNDHLNPVQLCPEARALLGNRNTGKGAVIGLRVMRRLAMMGGDLQQFVVRGFPTTGTVQQQVDHIEARANVYNLRPKRLAVGVPTGADVVPLFGSPAANYGRARARNGISINYWLETSGRPSSKSMTPDEFREYERKGLLMYQTQRGGNGVMPKHIADWLAEEEAPPERIRRFA